jgi:hypothetical protein
VDFQKKTKIFKIERQSLWAFQLIDKIKAVFSQPGYPKHIPNTIMPAYSATQHANKHSSCHPYFVLSKYDRGR